MNAATGAQLLARVGDVAPDCVRGDKQARRERSFAAGSVFGQVMGRLGAWRWWTLAALAAATLATAAPAAARPHGLLAKPLSGQRIERDGERFLDRFGDADPPARSLRAPAPITTPLLPDNRVLALYGAPQMRRTILGLRSPSAAAARLAKQSSPYATLGERPVIGAFDLVSVFATAGRGADGLYRSRQDSEVISVYLEQARAVGARLILDIQPGRSSFLAEIRALRDWVVQPDVDIALDPEWNVGPRGVPGRTVGKVSARQVRAVERNLAATVAANGLPPKLLVVHQFRPDSIRGRAQLSQQDGVQTLLNFDGIGSPDAKRAGYAPLSTTRLFNGFSLFYRLDEPLMQPASVLALEPQPDFLLYQ